MWNQKDAFIHRQFRSEVLRFHEFLNNFTKKKKEKEKKSFKESIFLRVMSKNVSFNHEAEYPESENSSKTV